MPSVKGAELHFMHVDDNPEYQYYNMESSWDQDAYGTESEHDKVEREEDISEKAKVLDRYISDNQIKSKYHVYHRVGKPYMRILELQKEINAELLMMPAHSHTLMDRLLVGSNTDYLLNHTPCPMYVYQFHMK